MAVHAPALALGGNRFGYILPTAIVILVLLILRAARIDPPKYASWLWLGVIGWGAAHIVLGLTPDSGEAARVLVRYALYAAIFLIAADIAREPFQGARLIRASALWITLICVYGLAAWRLGANPLLAELEAYPAALEATFINRNAFALYAVFGMLASLSLSGRLCVETGSIGVENGFWLTAALICAAAVVLTGSRGGLGAGAVGLGIFAFFWKGRRTSTFLLLATIIFAGFFGADYMRAASLIDDPRFAVHGLILAETAGAPITGYGLGAFQDAFRPSLGAEWRWGDWDHAHQQYLETAYELGWPAAFALFLAIAMVAPRPVGRDPFIALGLAALCAAAAHALVDFSLTIPSVAMTLALLMGVASGRRRRET